ncbi:hypothetical protein U9M48_007784 [Paspalum notatum var. saurae]|uniref:NB-ARC domain-containing protein n=1 Tax=Paspalum notatum var. saurae TaxID=547442 RepID=A0AAQ3SMV2_PASNO
MAAAFAAMGIRWALDTLSSMAPRLLTSSLPATSASSSSGSSHGMGMEDIRKLERTMHRINAVLQDAEDHWSMRDELYKLRLKLRQQYSLNVLAIVGGLGKTTLAQMVYDDDQKAQKNFNLRAWVCVSENYDVKNIYSQEISCVHAQWKDAALVQKIKGKSFLLVLDDLWNDRPKLLGVVTF